MGEQMILQPIGSPEVALAATYLIVNPYLSVSIAMQSANFYGEECRSKKSFEECVNEEMLTKPALPAS